MLTIALKLNPGKLKNPDADLRYEIPSRIEAVTGDGVTDGGFDYLADDSMVLLFQAKSKDNVAEFLQVLENEQFCGNHVLIAATVGVSSGGVYVVVHPEGHTGEFNIEV